MRWLNALAKCVVPSSPKTPRCEVRAVRRLGLKEDDVRSRVLHILKDAKAVPDTSKVAKKGGQIPRSLAHNEGYVLERTDCAAAMRPVSVLRVY